MGRASLTDDQREIIAMLVTAGWKTERIALAMDVSRVTVWRIRRELIDGAAESRSLRRIRKELEGVAR